mgnify:FL=1
MLSFPIKGGFAVKSVMDLFRELREDNDCTQSEIATVLGISQQHYSKYETGEYELPLRHFITLAKYYNVSADYLIGRCSFDEKNSLDLMYITRDCSSSELLQDILSLSELGRKAVIEYVELQKLKEAKM